MLLDSFKKAWEVFVGHIQDSWLFDNRTISAPAVRCLEKAIKASASAGPEQGSVVLEALEVVWHACNEMGEAILKRGTKTTPIDVPMKPFTQESLTAFVDVIRSTRTVARQFEDKEWTLERLTRLMSILKGELQILNLPGLKLTLHYGKVFSHIQTRQISVRISML